MTTTTSFVDLGRLYERKSNGKNSPVIIIPNNKNKQVQFRFSQELLRELLWQSGMLFEVTRMYHNATRLFGNIICFEPKLYSGIGDKGLFLSRPYGKCQYAYFIIRYPKDNKEQLEDALGISVTNKTFWEKYFIQDKFSVLNARYGKVLMLSLDHRGVPAD